MTTPQKGIFVEGNRCQHVLEYTLPAGTAPETIAVALEAARAAHVEIVACFGPSLWAQLARRNMPSGLTDFQPIDGPQKQAPATQRDLMLWMHGATREDVLDAAMAVDDLLSPVATRELDLTGFTYRDSRDLTGFVDGSANPKDMDGRLAAALVPEGEPGAGGAIVFSQMWVHDLESFNALDVPDQEKVFGRTKPDSIEMEGDDLPADSHVGRTDLKIDGVGQKMYRRSMPYGTASQQGLYFLAFCCDQSRFENVLNSMFGLAEDGISDHLLQFSNPVTGSYWFAPCEEDLAEALS